MVRTYKRKKNKPPPSDKEIIEALVSVKTSGKSLREVSLTSGIPKATLHHYAKRFKESSNIPPDTKIKPTFHHLQVLTPTHPSWVKRQIAGKDWLTNFLKRNQRLSIRKPEATSQGRAAALNKVVMNKFYDQVNELYEKYNFDAESVFNGDETNNPTVVDPAKIIARKSTHQVHQMTSAERGVNVTMLPFINAAGKLFPGVFVFPRKNVNHKMALNMPEGFIAVAHTSGWMTEETFLTALKHLHSQVKSTKENPILLFLDNHVSHMGYSICVFAKENGIVLQTLPPHTSHASQPLDRTVYKPFKCHLAESHSDWMRDHPGQRISIYEVPLLSKPAIAHAFTEHNIKKGFKATGLYPFDRNAIPDSMFAPSAVTGLPASAPSQSSTRQNGLTLSSVIHHLPTQVNQTLRLEIPSTQSVHQTTLASQEAPLSQYLLSVSSIGKLTLTPITIAASVQQLPVSSSSEMLSTCPTQIIETEQQQTSIIGSSSTISHSSIATSSNQSSPELLLSTPVSFCEPHSFRPHDILPLPQVAQSGPRVTKPNKRFGSSRCLTSFPEMRRLREEHDEKQRKQQEMENRMNANVTKGKVVGKRKSKLQDLEDVSKVTTPTTVAGLSKPRKKTSRVLRFDKENAQPSDLQTEDEFLPSSKQCSQVVIRRESISRAVKQTTINNASRR